MLKKQYQKNNSCKVTFVLPKESFHAESANTVKVLGEFNNWNWEEGLTMKPAKDAFQASIKLDAGKSYQFRYVVEGQGWLNDPAADRYVPSPFPGIDNSVIDVEVATNGNGAAETKKAPAKKTATKKTTAKKATTKKATTKAKKDDIKKHIEGVGPKIEKLLAEKDITTFEGLAKAKISVLKEILDAAGPRFKMHDPATWSEQAKLAAKGEWDQLAKLQEELKGGKRVK
jgi:predicted flap endonuclease-1-like 5' DNA nuclease